MHIIPMTFDERTELGCTYPNMSNKCEQKDALFYKIVEAERNIGFVAAFDVDTATRTAKLYAETDPTDLGKLVEAMIRFMKICFCEIRFHRLWSEYAENDGDQKHFWDALRFVEEGTARDTVVCNGYHECSMRRSLLAHEYVRFFGNPNNIQKVLAEFA